jgi:hypothetical protein
MTPLPAQGLMGRDRPAVTEDVCALASFPGRADDQEDGNAAREDDFEISTRADEEATG